MRRVVRGDSAAFALIAERHEQALLRHCRAILRNEEDARDAVQSTFERALRALENERRTIVLRPWLYRIAHNEAVSLMRRRRPTGSLDDEVADRTASVESQVLMSERLRQLLDDLDDLPERQSGALLMRELSGLGYTEIGIALETSEQSARQCVYEARVMLFELAKGREMDCDDVRRRVSARDGRLLRPRHVRAHLRVCGDCTAFREAIGGRRAELAALSPAAVPLVGGGLLRALLSGGQESGGRLTDALSRAADPLAASLTAKGAALVTAATLAGGGSLLTQHAGDLSQASSARSGEAALVELGPAQASHAGFTSHGERVTSTDGPAASPDRAYSGSPAASGGPARLGARLAPAEAQPLAGLGSPPQASLVPADPEPSTAAPGRPGGEHSAPAPTALEAAPTAQAAPQPGPAAEPAPADDPGAPGADPGKGNAQDGVNGNAHASNSGQGNGNTISGNPGAANASPGNGNAKPGNANVAAGNGDPGSAQGGGRPGGNSGTGQAGNRNAGEAKPNASGPAGQDRGTGKGR